MIKIFSDESGCWKNIDEYYIRAWIAINEENYDILKKELLFVMHNLKKITELKWKNIKNNIDKYKYIFEIPEFNIFITVSKPLQFFNTCYKIIEYLKSKSIENYFGSLDENAVSSLKESIVNSAQNTLFLHIFERHHIRTAKNALVEQSNNAEYEFIIDNPQFPKNQWKKVASEEGLANVKIIEKSEDGLGIQIADIIAGCFHDLLKKNGKAEKVFANFIKKKMCDMYCTDLPNPNIVFNDIKTKDLFDRIKEIRTLKM
jgi:hypothetical protein